MTDVLTEKLFKIINAVIDCLVVCPSGVSRYAYVAVNHVSSVTLDEAKHIFKCTFVIQFVVTSHKVEPLTFCACKTLIHPVIYATVWLTNDCDAYTRKESAKRVKRFKRSVVRASILDDDFKVSVGLIANAIQASRDKAIGIERRYDN